MQHKGITTNYFFPIKKQTFTSKWYKFTQFRVGNGQGMAQFLVNQENIAIIRIFGDPFTLAKLTDYKAPREYVFIVPLWC